MPVRTRSTCRACVTFPRRPPPARTTGPFSGMTGRLAGTTTRPSTAMADLRRPIPDTTTAAPGHRAGARSPARRYLGPFTPVRSLPATSSPVTSQIRAPPGTIRRPARARAASCRPPRWRRARRCPRVRVRRLRVRPLRVRWLRVRPLSDRAARRRAARFCAATCCLRMPRPGRLRAGKAFAARLRRAGGSPIVRSPMVRSPIVRCQIASSQIACSPVACSPVVPSPVVRSRAGRWPTGCHRSLTCWRRHRARTTRGHRVARPQRPSRRPPGGSSHRPGRTCCPSPVIRP
jgi:hypothetical protein